MEVNYNSEDLLDHHAVSAVIRNSKGEILMQDHVKYGFWTIPIGKVKENQTVIEGLKEEVLEECNLVIQEMKEISKEEKTYLRNGKDVNLILHVYEVLSYSGELNNNEPHKHREQRFIPIDEIKKMPYLSDMTVLFLENIGFKRDAKIRKS